MRLAGEFPDVSIEDWRTAALKALRGGAGRRLRTELYEGFATEPLYTRATAHAAARALRAARRVAFHSRRRAPPAGARPWTVIQLLDHLDIAEANRQLRRRGQWRPALWLQFGGNIPYGGALSARASSRRWRRCSPACRWTASSFTSPAVSIRSPAPALIAALIEKRGAPPAKLKGSAGLDPLSVIAASGHVPAERGRSSPMRSMRPPISARRAMAGGRFWSPGRAWHQAGGSAREELGFALAAAVTYWRELIERGWPLDEAAARHRLLRSPPMPICSSPSPNSAPCARCGRASPKPPGLPPEPPVADRGNVLPHGHRARPVCEPAARDRGRFRRGGRRRGGVLLIPFNTCHGTPDAFARRLARNTQLILRKRPISAASPMRRAAPGMSRA